ncbi:MAG: hypothetical protein ACYCPS_06925, partial [Candidatus Saccharimonadales bacterium]
REVLLNNFCFHLLSLARCRTRSTVMGERGPHLVALVVLLSPIFFFNSHVSLRDMISFYADLHSVPSETAEWIDHRMAIGVFFFLFLGALYLSRSLWDLFRVFLSVLAVISVIYVLKVHKEAELKCFQEEEFDRVHCQGSRAHRTIADGCDHALEVIHSGPWIVAFSMIWDRARDALAYFFLEYIPIYFYAFFLGICVLAVAFVKNSEVTARAYATLYAGVSSRMDDAHRFSLAQYEKLGSRINRMVNRGRSPKNLRTSSRRRIESGGEANGEK